MADSKSIRPAPNRGTVVHFDEFRSWRADADRALDMETRLQRKHKEETRAGVVELVAELAESYGCFTELRRELAMARAEAKVWRNEADLLRRQCELQAQRIGSLQYSARRAGSRYEAARQEGRTRSAALPSVPSARRHHLHPPRARLEPRRFDRQSIGDALELAGEAIDDVAAALEPKGVQS